MMDTLSIFSLGMSNTSASLYVGFSVFFLMEVFLFFSLRPSQIREAFTYGSEEERESGEKGRGGGSKRRFKKKGRKPGRWDEKQQRRKIEGDRQRGGGSRGNKIRGGLLQALLGIMLTGICNT